MKKGEHQHQYTRRVLHDELVRLFLNRQLLDPFIPSQSETKNSTHYSFVIILAVFPSLFNPFEIHPPRRIKDVLS